MAKSGIEWCDYSWNPISGCRRGCNYCASRKMSYRWAGDTRLNLAAKKDYSTVKGADGKGICYVLEEPMMNESGNQIYFPFAFEPTLHAYKMDFPSRYPSGKNILVGDMGDMFGDWIPEEWIMEVFTACLEYPVHNYLFLTKNPKRYQELEIPADANFWYGTTVTTESEYDRIKYLPDYHKKYVNFEPLLEDVHPAAHRDLLNQVDWIIVGAETGTQRTRTTPDVKWVEDLVKVADELRIPIYMRSSLLKYMKDVRSEVPPELDPDNMRKSEAMQSKLYANCAVCKQKFNKSHMLALLVRYKRLRQPVQYGFMCHECFAKRCNDLGLEVPDFAELLKQK